MWTTDNTDNTSLPGSGYLDMCWICASLIIGNHGVHIEIYQGTEYLKLGTGQTKSCSQTQHLDQPCHQINAVQCELKLLIHLKSI